MPGSAAAVESRHNWSRNNGDMRQSDGDIIFANEKIFSGLHALAFISNLRVSDMKTMVFISPTMVFGIQGVRPRCCRISKAHYLRLSMLAKMRKAPGTPAGNCRNHA